MSKTFYDELREQPYTSVINSDILLQTLRISMSGIDMFREMISKWGKEESQRLTEYKQVNEFDQYAVEVVLPENRQHNSLFLVLSKLQNVSGNKKYQRIATLAFMATAYSDAEVRITNMSGLVDKPFMPMLTSLITTVVDYLESFSKEEKIELYVTDNDKSTIQLMKWLTRGKKKRRTPNRPTDTVYVSSRERERRQKLNDLNL